MQSRFEVADVLRKIGSKIENYGLNTWQLRTLSALKKCRTAALGGHIDACDGCGNLSISYNSCRNRHCPKCQGNKREDWIQARSTELLPVPYFHVVFTLPSSINSLAIHQPKMVYDTLFEASWETLKTFGKAKEMQMGMIAVLHTWGQQLSLHPHLHCIVPGGGVDTNGKWKTVKSKAIFYFLSRHCLKCLELNIARNSRLNIQLVTNKSGKNYGKNLGLFLPKSLLVVQNRWWNIWGDTLIKLPLAIRELKISTTKMSLLITRIIECWESKNK